MIVRLLLLRKMQNKHCVPFHFLSAPSLFFNRRRKMRGIKVSVVRDDA
jgi:hypothetical protein